MSDGVIFAIGSVIFIFLSWATTVFLMKQFSLQYRTEEPDVGLEVGLRGIESG